MSYTLIPELPISGPVNATKDLLVLEQDVTKKITPLKFLSDSISQLYTTTTITGSELIPISDLTAKNTANLTINNLMKYINTHLNVIHQVFYVNSYDGVDIDDVDERGKNVQLPYKTIKYAAKKVAEAIASNGQPPTGALGGTYNPADPNYSLDTTTVSPSAVSSQIRKQYSISVTSGDYTENNPIYIPPNTSLIGDNLRRTVIRPLNPQLDILWLNSANYVWGFTFRDHKDPSAATAFPISSAVYISNVPLDYAPVDYAGINGQNKITSPIFSTVSNLIDNINQVIVSQNNIPTTIPAGVISDSSYTIASQKILSAKAQIQQEVVNYSITNYPTAMSDNPTLTAKCFRDTGYIVDALAADIANNANHRCIEVGNLYFKGVLKTLTTGNGTTIPVIPTEEITPTINAISQIATYLNNNILTTPDCNARQTDVSNRVADIVYPLQNSGALNSYIPSGSPTSQDLNAASIIATNKTALQNQTSQYVIDKGYLQAGPLSDICHRDIGLILDAIISDLNNGVNSRTIEYALAYWSGSTSRIPNSLVQNHADKTTDTYNKLKSYIFQKLNPNVKTWVQDSYNIAYNTPGYEIASTVIPSQRPNIYVSPYVQGCTSYAISDRMPTNIVGDNTDNPKYPTTWTVVGVKPPNNAGMGMRIDGSLVTGFIRSMVIDSFTQINQGGKGIYLLNNGYAQFVSTFTVATEQGIVCEAGGTCSVSTSNSTFGLSGLVARGMSYSPVLSGKFVIPNTSYAYPIASAPSIAGNTNGVYGYTAGGNLLTINDIQSLNVYYKGDNFNNYTELNPPMTVASIPYATLCFTIGDDQPWDRGDGTMVGPGYLLEDTVNPLIRRTDDNGNPIHEVKLFYIEQGAPTPSLSGGNNIGHTDYDIYNTYNLSKPTDSVHKPSNGLPWDINLSYNLEFDLTKLQPLPAYDSNNNPIQYMIDYKGNRQPIQYKHQDGSTINSQDDYISTTGGIIDFTNAPVRFYARSVIETGSHTFEYMGTGTRIKYAIPAFGGVTNNSTEAISDGINDENGNRPGTVFFTSSNELGNFKVGTDFTIVQSTGTIQGDTFNRAILTLVTPLNIALE